ncbi:hypothetical protein [Patulibacter sp. SYSU D01012]|uniref:hypothetical protein n=1 Tax=Patulibacter sp. SYSU D01012 TaxID=2817381 RepID=UPI001B30F1B9|nr:hypothetical protein [Patulibacter sp. SYSU D01012]
MEPIPVQQARARYAELMTAPRALLELEDPDDARAALVPAAALVFALGAWEACAEELFRGAAVAVVGAARRPSDLPRAIRDTIVEVVGEPGEPWEHVLRRLGGGWHRAAIRHLGTSLDYRFRHWNTPSAAGVDRLAEQVAGMGPISPSWPSLDGHPGADVLDEAIRRRGEAVHLARTAFGGDVVAPVLDLLDGIVDATAAAVTRRIGHLPPVTSG